MKSLVGLAVVILVYSCGGAREMQVEMQNAELVKIDTVYRYPGTQQVLTWRCAKNIEYVSFVPISRYYKVGYKTPVLVRK